MSSTTTKAICRSHSLYEVEQALELLVEAAEQTPDDPSLPAAVGEYLEAALEKRDNVARFLGHLEQQQDFARAEIRRLKDRESRLAALQERIESYVIHFLEAKGLRKLDGNRSSLVLRGCPPSVVIHDPSVIPAEFLVIKQETVPDKKALNSSSSRPGCSRLRFADPQAIASSSLIPAEHRLLLRAGARGRTASSCSVSFDSVT